MPAKKKKPTTPRTQFVSKARQEKFLEAFARTLNVSQAAREIGIHYGSSVLYSQKRADEEFRERWDAIEQSRLDELEALQWKAALEFREDRRWVLSRRRPNKWSERHTTVGGKVEIEHTVNLKELSREELLRIATGGAVEGSFKVLESENGPVVRDERVDESHQALDGKDDVSDDDMA